MARKTKEELEAEKLARKQAREGREQQRAEGLKKVRARKGQVREGLLDMARTIPGSIGSTQAYRTVKRMPKTAMEYGALAVYGFEIRDLVKIQRKAESDVMDYIAQHGDKQSDDTLTALKKLALDARVNTLKKWQEAVDEGVGTKKDIADWVRENLTKENASAAFSNALQKMTLDNAKAAPGAMLKGTANLANTAMDFTLDVGSEMYGRGKGLVKGEDLKGRDGRVITARAKAARLKKTVADKISENAGWAADAALNRKKVKGEARDEIIMSDKRHPANWGEFKGGSFRSAGSFEEESPLKKAQKEPISPYVDGKAPSLPKPKPPSGFD